MSRREILTLFRKTNNLVHRQQNVFVMRSCQLCKNSATTRLLGRSQRRSFASQTRKLLSQVNVEKKDEDDEYTHFGYEKVRESEKVNKGILDYNLSQNMKYFF